MRTIQRVEAGNKASLETLNALAAVLEVDISQLKDTIMVIDKDSGQWKSENALIRFALLGVKKRQHMLALEWSLVTIALVAWVFASSSTISSILPLLAAYGSAKLIACFNGLRYW